MLRECRRILRPGGLIAGYVIHTASGLGPEDCRRAAELGPTEVLAPGTPEELARSAGFEVVTKEDVTAEFGSTCTSFLKARTELQASLRAEEGDAAYEDELRKKKSMLRGVEERLLLRSLMVASIL